METEVTKKEWESMKSAAESAIRNAKATIILMEVELKTISRRLAAFPKETLEVPDELK